MESISYKGFTINVDYDQFGTSPEEWGNFTINEITTSEDLEDKELQAKLKDGRAFLIDKYEHSAVIYRLAGVNVDRWDTSRNWGYIEFTDEYADNFDDLEGRRTMAESDLEEYTAWANGEVYAINVYDPYGDRIDDFCTSDIIGKDWAIDEAKRLIDGYGINYAEKAKHAGELHQ